MSAFSGLLLIAACAWLWLDATRARELAVHTCIRGCQQRGVQLLDQTVALVRLSPAIGRGRLTLRRIYRFEYSEEGVERQDGHLTLIGRDLVEFSLGLPTTIGERSPPQGPFAPSCDDPDPNHEKSSDEGAKTGVRDYPDATNLVRLRPPRRLH